jgi:hypothetical protein
VSAARSARALQPAAILAALLGPLALAPATRALSSPSTPPVDACPPAPSLMTAPGTAPRDVLEPAPERLIACVGVESITGAAFARWLTIARISEPRAPSAELVSEVMSYLISSDWIFGEARARHIHVSAGQVRRRFEQIRRMEFPRHGELGAFEESSGETVADLLFRVRLNMVSERLTRQVERGYRNQTARSHAFARFIRRFQALWRARSYCESAYAVKDCGHVQAAL